MSSLCFHHEFQNPDSLAEQLQSPAKLFWPVLGERKSSGEWIITTLQELPCLSIRKCPSSSICLSTIHAWASPKGQTRHLVIKGPKILVVLREPNTVWGILSHRRVARCPYLQTFTDPGKISPKWAKNRLKWLKLVVLDPNYLFFFGILEEYPLPSFPNIFLARKTFGGFRGHPPPRPMSKDKIRQSLISSMHRK